MYRSPRLCALNLRIYMINTELLKGSMATLVLTLLSRKEMYGYDIMKEIEKASDQAISVKEGTLYPILHALEKEEAVEAYWVENSKERRRKYYKITSKGRKVLKQRKADWDAFKGLIDRLLVTSLQLVNL